MPNALDPSGKPIDVAPSELAAKWRAGEVQLVAGQKYHVAMPAGGYYAVPAESLHTALANGGTIVSPADVAEHLEAEEYGGIKGKAIAAGAGFVEQATLGGVSQGLPQSWHAPIAASQRQNPLSYGVGEVGGALALGAALPGGGAAGLVERGVGAALEGAGESTMGRIAARATLGGLKSAAGGAQFGAAQAISDDAIADHKLTAAQMIATIKANVLWGGALGAGAGALGGAVFGRTAAKALAPEDTVVGRVLSRGGTDADVEAVAAKAVGSSEPAPGLGAKVRGWYARLSSAASGADAKDIEPFVGEQGAANRQALREAGATRESAAAKIREQLDTHLSESSALQDQYKGSLKRGYLKASVAEVEPAAAAQASRSMADKALSSLDEMIKNPDDYGGGDALTKTLKAVKKYSTKLDAAIQAGDVAEQYGLADDIKRAIGRPAKIATNLDERGARTEWDVLQNRARATGLQELYESMRVGLEDEGVWKKAATDQQAINRAWTTNIDASKRFHAALTTEGPRGADQGFGRNPRIVDPEKVDSYVKNLVNPSKDLTHQAVRDYVTSSRDLASVMGQSLELPAAEASGVQKIAKSADAFHKTLEETSKSLTLTNQFEAIRAKSGEGASGLLSHLATVGAIVGGAPGAVLGKTIGKVGELFTRPADAIWHLSGVEQMMRESDSRVVRALRGFASGSHKPTTPTELAGFARKSAQVKALSVNPDLLQERVAANLGPVRGHAPKLADALTMTTLAGLALLRDKMPASIAPDPLDPLGPVPPPSEGARATWLRYYDAVKDPHGVVEDLRSGRLTPEGVEVLKTVYPPLYARTQQLAMTEMASRRMKALNFQKRIGLGMLLELPLPELAPAYVAERQAAYAQVDQESAAKSADADKTGGGKRSTLRKGKTPSLAADRVEGGAGS